MRSKQEVSELALQVAQGDNDAFRELERVAQPLLKSLASRFSNYHHKFEYDDFYNIGLLALYNACLSYHPRNPSFLNYAKTIILRDYWRQLEFWNAEKRNIYANDLSLDRMEEDGVGDGVTIQDDLAEHASSEVFCQRIEQIVDECFEPEKAEIMKAYLLHDHKISEIARETGIKYKNIHSTVTRGLEKVRKEYSSRFLDDSLAI